MINTSHNTQLSKEQIEYLSSLHFINKIDDHLKTIASIKVVEATASVPARVILILDIYFYDEKVDLLTFDLHNYSYDDIIEVVKDIRSNEFILQEVDNFLAGDLVE